MIYLTGDTHIPLDIDKLDNANFPAQRDLTQYDYVIVLGDFGLYWDDDDYGYAQRHYKWKKWLQERNFTTLWLDGNHENFDWINELPVSEWRGGKVHRDGSIIHLMRGQCYDIEEKTFLVAGGAQSYDRACRVAHISWWPDELWDYAQQETIFENIEKCRANGVKINYVLSHTCPTSLIRPMFDIDPNEDPDPTTKLLEEVLNRIGYDNIDGWYFGHWHADVDYGKFRCLYSKVIRLK